MRVFAGWVVIFAGQLAAGSFRPAAAAGEPGPPLLVAVEAEPGFDLDGQEIRKAIGAELGRKILSPAATASTDAVDVLLLAVSRARLVISFRGHADQQTVRSMPMPTDRSARLRAVAWMAGNLARDQVTPLILATAAASVPTDQPSPPSAPAPIENQTPAATVTQPPPWSAPTLPAASTAASADAEALRRQPAAEVPVDGPWWTVIAAAGLAAPYAAGYTDLKTWQIEVQNHRSDRWLWGGAVDFGPQPHHLGYALTGGRTQRWRGFRFDETAGVGLESKPGPPVTTVTNSSTTGASSETTRTLGWSPYARLFVTAAHPLWRSWDVVLRLGAHFSPEGTLDDAFLAGTVGLCMRLP